MAHEQLTADFAARSRAGSDISDHLPALSGLAAECSTATEFGVRSGNSTIALLHGLAVAGAGSLTSYDQQPHQIEHLPPLPPFVTWRFHLADTGALEAIEPTDLLFIDTLHTCAQVRAELVHAPHVRKYLVFHDTVLFGWRDEAPGDGPGICQAIFAFLATEEGRKWEVLHHAPHNNGLLTLRRRSAFTAKKGRA